MDSSDSFSDSEEEFRCATCGSESLVKSGHNSCGTQQYLCKSCGAHRVLKAKTRATSETRMARVMRAVKVDRLSLRNAEKLFGVARQTIARWLQKHPPTHSL